MKLLNSVIYAYLIFLSFLCHGKPDSPYEKFIATFNESIENKDILNRLDLLTKMRKDISDVGDKQELKKIDKLLSNLAHLKTNLNSCELKNKDSVKLLNRIKLSLSNEVIDSKNNCFKGLENINDSLSKYSSEVLNITNYINADSFENNIVVEILILNAKSLLKHKKIYNFKYNEKFSNETFDKIVNQICPKKRQSCSKKLKSKMKESLVQYNKELGNLSVGSLKSTHKQLQSLTKDLNKTLNKVVIKTDPDESFIFSKPNLEEAQPYMRPYYEKLYSEFENGVGGLLLTNAISDELGRVKNLSIEDDQDYKDLKWYNPFTSPEYVVQKHDGEVSEDEVLEAIIEAENSIVKASKNAHRSIKEREENLELSKNSVRKAISKEFATQRWNSFNKKGQIRNLAKNLTVYPNLFTKQLMKQPEYGFIMCEIFSELEKMKSRDDYFKNVAQGLTYASAITGLSGLAIHGIKIGLRKTLTRRADKILIGMRDPAFKLALLTESNMVVLNSARTNEISKNKEDIKNATIGKTKLSKEDMLKLVSAQIEVDHAKFDLAVATAGLAGPAVFLGTMNLLKKIPRKGVSFRRLKNGDRYDIQVTNEKAIQLIHKKLSHDSVLKRNIINVLEDPNVSQNIKAIIRKALVSDVDFTTMTEYFRKLNNIGDKTAGVYIRGNASGIRVRNFKPEVFQYKAEVIAVKEGRESKDIVPVLTLIHELAHVRFHRYLDDNIGKLVEKLPKDLWSYTKNGKYKLDEDLETYLSERFSYEMEFRAVKELYPKFSMDQTNEWFLMKEFSLKEMRRFIASNVKRSYGTREDQRFYHLDERSLADIFLNGF